MEINVLVEEEFADKVRPEWLEALARKALQSEGTGAFEMGLVITSQEHIRELNCEYRSVDEPTDVLAFAMSETRGEGGFVAPPDGVRHLGEVIISYPQATIQAAEQGHSVERELAILLVHGVLHLLGYDHEEAEAERRMRAREKELLQEMGGGA